MLFTIYCLGDVKLFASALNGVAMMYKVAEGGNIDIWTSNLPFGLGYGALLGALMALLVMIYTGYQKKQLDFRSVLLPLILYFALTVPKATVVIQDQYSQQAPVQVDNVPIGLALPLGAISGIAYTATKQLETIYYVPYGGFTKITDEGYVAPLKLLHALKYTGISASTGIPNLKPTLEEISKICLVNNPSFNTKKYKSDIDGFSAFLSALQAVEVSNRHVVVPVSGAVKERVLSCAEAGDYVSSALDAYMAGRNSNATLQMLSDADLEKSNFKSDVKKALTKQENASENQGVGYTTNGQIVSAIGSLAGANNAEVLQFLKTTILDSTLSGVNHCTATNLQSDKAKCQNYLTSIEQWKEKTSADASGFVSIMRDGQNLLIVLSIILFPLVLIVVIIQGVSSFKVFGSYILFTICSFMWLPVASIINYYTHLQLHEEFQRFNPTGDPKAFLSLKNAPAFYDAVSVKLALANGALASVPMICMGLFSGMLMTINGLVDKWNTQAKHYDAKETIPDSVKRAPIASVGSSVNYASINGKATLTGLAQAQNTSKGMEISQALKQVEGASEKNTKNLERMLSDKNVKNLSFDQKWAMIEKTVDRMGNGQIDDNTRKTATGVLFATIFEGKENGQENYTKSVDKDGSTVITFKNGSTLRAGVKFGFELGDNSDNDPDKDKKPDDSKNKFSKGLNKVLKKSLLGPDVGMANIVGGEVAFQDSAKIGDKSEKSYGIQENDSSKSVLTHENANRASRANQFTTEFQDALAAEMNKSVTEQIANQKSNTSTVSWSQKVTDYQRSSDEVQKAYSYAMQQSRDSDELANQIRMTPELANNIRANIQASNMENNSEYQAHVAGLIQQMNVSSLKAISEDDKLLLAQHTALKMMGGQTAVQAIEAEYGSQQFKTLADNFMEDHKVKEGISGVFQEVGLDKKIQEAKDANYDVNIEGHKNNVQGQYASMDDLSTQAVQHRTVESTAISRAESDHDEREKDLKIDKLKVYQNAPIVFDEQHLSQGELTNVTAAKDRAEAWDRTNQNMEKASELEADGHYLQGAWERVKGTGSFFEGVFHNTVELVTPTADDVKGLDRSTGQKITYTAQEAAILQNKTDENPLQQYDESKRYVDRQMEKLDSGNIK